MSRQSGFLLRQEQERDAVIQAAQGIMIQYLVDTLQITMREKHGWEYDQLNELADDWKATRKHYQAAIDPHHSMSDVMQEHMQRVFDDICANKGIPSTPWEARYPNLKRVRYDKKYKR